MTNAAEFHPGRDNVFARIADRYDFLCDVFSLYIQRYWKSFMARAIANESPGIILDVASGTGDIPLRLLKHWQPAQMMVTDLCPEMLNHARRKIGKGANVHFTLADGHNLCDVADETIDLYSISFGLKICDREKIMREAFRVLRPGGIFFCLEASHIPIPWVHRLYLRYMHWCLPLIARLVTGGDKSAYDYLLRGIDDIPSQQEVVVELKAHGFTVVSFRNLSFGIVTLHRAVKPL